jgi:hypothetical protein
MVLKISFAVKLSVSVTTPKQSPATEAAGPSIPKFRYAQPIIQQP